MKTINFRIQKAIYEILPAVLFTVIVLVNRYSIVNKSVRTILLSIAIFVVVICMIFVQKLHHEVQDERTKNTIYKAGDVSFRITLLAIMAYVLAIYLHILNAAPVMPLLAVSYSVLKVVDALTFCVMDKKGTDL